MIAGKSIAFHRNRLAKLALCLLAVGVSCGAGAQVPAVPDLPGNLPVEASRKLLAQRDQFAARRESFLSEGKAHNQRCRDVPLDTPEATACAAARNRLAAELVRLRQASAALQAEIGGETGRAALAEKRRAEQMVTDISHGAAALLPPDFPRIEEIENSPGVEAWRRGMDASINHDWPLALAWFQTARQKDPENAALGRAVELAQWISDQRRNIGARAGRDPPLPQPASAASGAVQLPQNEDLEFLFSHLGTDDAAMVERDIQLFYDAEPPAPAGSLPDAPLREITATARRAFAHELQGLAMIRIMDKDFAGAAALLDAAEKQAPEVPNYRKTRDLVRGWIDQGVFTK